MPDARDQWSALADEKAEALGIPSHEVREAVQRELVSRVASEIAEELLKPPPVSGSRPLTFG